MSQPPSSPPPEPVLRADPAEVAEIVLAGEQTPLLLRWPVIATIAITLAAIVAGYVVLAQALGFSTEIDAEPFREWVDEFGAWGPAIFIGVLALSVLFAPIPNAPIFIAAGLIWGAILGTVYSVAGLLIGSIIAFSLARRLGRRHLPRLVGAKTAGRLDRLAETMGGKVIFWARMLPAVNFDWISFVAGVTAIRFREFVVWSFAGMILPTGLVVTAGDGLGRDFRITILMGAIWVIGIALSALIFWSRRRRNTRPA